MSGKHDPKASGQGTRAERRAAARRDVRAKTPGGEPSKRARRLQHLAMPAILG